MIRSDLLQRLCPISIEHDWEKTIAETAVAGFQANKLPCIIIPQPILIHQKPGHKPLIA